ncbi:MAG: transglutaminase-like domain-containing protein [Candidatus Bathyarchaeia archaeon]
MVGYLRYEIQNEERGALWALENGIGDCSEYSYLFIALCRAAGIPARIQAGFTFHYAGQVLKDGHMWAEYYLENYGWMPVDATWQLFNTIDSKHFSSFRSIP